MSGEGGPNGVDLQVGAALGRLRRRAGFSRERLAAVLDVSQQRLQAWEAGTERVRASELYSVTRALGAPVSDVFAELTPPARATNDVGDEERAGRPQDHTEQEASAAPPVTEEPR